MVLSENIIVPFETKEEVIEAVRLHGNSIIDPDDGDLYTITHIGDNFITVGACNFDYQYFKTFKFLDGIPFGKIIN